MTKFKRANADSANKYLGLKDDVFLKRLEMPAVYRTSDDSLYEVDEKTFAFLQMCDGRLRVSELKPPDEFLHYILSEGIAVLSDTSKVRKNEVGTNLIPSLRYLLVETTNRCNLSCRHCYQGEAKAIDLPLGDFLKVTEEFEEMGGLRLIVSGGEPLLHPRFDKINQLMKKRAFRSILLTNGTLLNESVINELNFGEVQVSLDGLEEGHDFLRGSGSFEKSFQALRRLIKTGIPVSVATMVHARNVDEFEELERLVKELGAISWSIDVPSKTGRLEEHGELLPPLDRLRNILQLQFGAEIHDSQSNLVCGAHLACVRSNGVLTKCGFYTDWSGGSISKGLRKCWQELPRMSLSELNCDCGFVNECRGGCRYRAECYNNAKGADPIKCLLYGIEITQDMHPKRDVEL